MSSVHSSFLLLDDISRGAGENSAAASTSSSDSWITDFSHFSMHEMYKSEIPQDSMLLRNCCQFKIADDSASNKPILNPLINEHIPETSAACEKLGNNTGVHTDSRLNLCFSAANGHKTKSRMLKNTNFEEQEVFDSLVYTDNKFSPVTDTCILRKGKSTSSRRYCANYVEGSEQQLTDKPVVFNFHSDCAPETDAVCSYPLHEGSQQPLKMRTKLKSLWENMKYGWRVKQQPSFKNDSPIWLLGKYYHTKLYDTQDEPSLGNRKPEDISKASFKEDLSSRIWLTYRYNFPSLGEVGLTTDSGWGCMLRAGQMIMAQGLVCHLLGRDWHLSKDNIKLIHHRMIIRWFADNPSPCSPFSIHKLVSVGTLYGKKAGEWYGPAHIIHVLREALMQERERNPDLKDICVYATPDGIVFKQDIVDLCTSSQPEHSILSTGPFLNKSLLTPLSSHPKLLLAQQIPDGSNSPHPQVVKNLESKDENSIIESLELNAKKTNNKKLLTKVPLKSHSLSSEQRLSNKACVCKSHKSTDLNPNFSSFEHDKKNPHCNNTACLHIRSSHPIHRSVWKSVIIFVAVRLGNDRMNPFYIPSLKSLLAYEHCIGIIGGRPKHAVYFVGWHGNKLIHLDPHFCQSVEDVSDPNIKLKTYHCSSPCTMPFSDMDPSCAVGFYLKTQNEFEEFTEKIVEMSTSVKRNMEYPIFALSEGRRADAEASCTSQHDYATVYDGLETFQQDEDDYIVL